MNRTATGLCCAAALGLAATLGAQSPATTTSQPGSSTDKEVTISGCLAKGASGFMLNNARVEPNASSSTTTAAGSTSTTTASGSTTTGSATTTGGSGTTGTTGAMATASSPAMTWVLSGDSELDKHVGHKIQVTGKTTWDASMDPARSATSTTGGSTTTATSSTTTTAGSANQPRLDVKSIKMVSASCS